MKFVYDIRYDYEIEDKQCKSNELLDLLLITFSEISSPIKMDPSNRNPKPHPKIFGICRIACAKIDVIIAQNN